MTWYRVVFTGVMMDVEGERRTPVTDSERVKGSANRILEEMVKLGASSPRVETWPSNARVQVEVRVQEESEVVLATMAGFVMIRTAVHAAGLGTPGWQVEWLETTTVSSDDDGRSARQEPITA